ncbi:MAG: protein kinase domain-containing protein, partial [Pirellula sp.]
IKVRKSSGNSKQSNDSYLEEAQFAAGLRHPNIVTVFTVERTPSDELFIVSEYIEGGTLKDHIDAQDFDYPQIAKTILSVAEALGHAHQRGLIHRDIKPANILVEASTRNAFVVDFGLATREFEYLQRSDGAGSPAYKSPEQIRREGQTRWQKRSVLTRNRLLRIAYRQKALCRKHHLRDRKPDPVCRTDSTK